MSVLKKPKCLMAHYPPYITENIKVKTTLGKPLSYRLLSLPVYLTERLYELIEQALKMKRR